MPRYLLVEDNTDLHIIIRLYLKDIAEVDGVTSFEQGLQAAQERAYDLFIIDIQLGHGPTGVDLLRELRKMDRYKTTPAVAFTATTNKANQTKMYAEGFDAFLGKPFERHDLRYVINGLTGATGRASGASQKISKGHA